MTEVVFHFNAPDRLTYACRLLRKAYSKGARLLVLTDSQRVAELDQQLWTMAGTEFVPHCTDSASPAVQAKSPIIITSLAPSARGHEEVLVNLSDQFPEQHASFARVIEVITADAQVRSLARERWKRYKAQGLDPSHLDLLKTPAQS